MSRRKPLILVVDDDAEYRRSTEAILSENYAVVLAEDADAANRKINLDVSLVLLDLRLTDADDADHDSLRLLEAIREVRDVPIVVMTAFGDIDIAVEAMKSGAADFIQKARTDARELKKVIATTLEKHRLERRVSSFEAEKHRLQMWDLVGDSTPMREVRKLVDMVADDGYTSVLIRGETGTGKELVARAIHSRGWRNSEGAFVAAAIPGVAPTLVERELFGHVKGAFTDAYKDGAGFVAQASGGVLFLDEIGDVAPDIQPKLLRFLDTHTYSRVGSPAQIKVDLQLVCATNRNLEEAVRDGRFREDLYYRIKTVQITLPPLRERIEDVPLLVDHFLFQFRQSGRTRVAGVTAAAMQQLSRYSYPGNVRELHFIVDRAAMTAGMHGHALVDMDDLPIEVTTSVHPLFVSSEASGFSLDAELARAELAHIERALRVSDGRKSDAWRALGLNDRFALLRRVKRIRDQYPDLVEKFPLVRSSYVETDHV
jgi:DNA-binding NtrC family response regulator